MTATYRFTRAGALMVALSAAFLPGPSAPYARLGSGPVVGAGSGDARLPVPALHLRLEDLPSAEALGAGRPAGPGSTGGGAAGAVAQSGRTVGPGDSLWDIARSAGVSVAALAAANNLSENTRLHPGQVLHVPPRGTPAAVAAARMNAPAHQRPVPSQPPASILISYSPASAQISHLPTPLPDPRDLAAPSTAVDRLRMLWPSSGTVTSRFGWRTHPIFGTREFHTGLDIATRWGSPVTAALGGVVKSAGWMAGYGRLIVLDHGSGLQTLYSHLSTTLVGSGQRVDQGQVIGRIGSTGWSTGPHLFFEVRENGVAQDPSRYLY